jgi:hypothetical protein
LALGKASKMLRKHPNSIARNEKSHENHKTKKSCHWQDPFQNINPNITLEIKSFHLIIENSAKPFCTALKVSESL